jgi:hypothetical protein
LLERYDVELDAILYQIDGGDLALPEFQRGYVWNRDQVRGFMSSLYKRYPVGGLLVWVTATENAPIRSGARPTMSSVRMLLDGQQRITTLYGIVRGSPPPFFEGDKNAFTGLYFHLGEESFEFYSSAKMAHDPMWIDVTKLMVEGLGWVLPALPAGDAQQTFFNRLNRVAQIAKIDFHIEEVVGADKTLDVVVDIFNRVNSGGTKLSKGDLALAKLCAEWPEARQTLRSQLAIWGDAGFQFKLEWLLRVVTTVQTGQAFFSGLEGVTSSEFQESLTSATKAVSYLLNLISARLGLDHDRVLGGRYAFPVMAKYVVQKGGKITSSEEQGKLLFWYIHSFLWGRYAGSTETTLNRDLTVLAKHGLDGLIEELRTTRADLVVRSTDFAGNTRGARFYPMLYLLTRTGKARDLAAGGLQLDAHMLGNLASLQVHHIFPQAKLYAAKYPRGQVNAIANFCFLTQDANLEILDRSPEDYFSEAETKIPGALQSQWIPTNPALRPIDEYLDFLAARRELLASAANEILEALISALAPASEVPAEISSRASFPVQVDELDVETVQETSNRVDDLVKQYGLAQPERIEVVVDEETGRELGIADFFWPDGLQGGYDEPVVLVLDGDPDEIKQMAQIGYRVLTSLEFFETLLERRSVELVGS